jgi:KDO2-lipid IV(A) lauroyltransferase
MPRFLTGLVSHLPLAILHALGALLGWVVYGLSPTYRRHLRANLRAAGYEDAGTLRAAIAGAGRQVAELPYVWLRPRAEVLAKVRRIEGQAHIDAARAAGKGILFLTPHLGCFEVTAMAAAKQFPITVLYRAPRMAWLQPLIEEGRGGRNVQLAKAEFSGVRKLITALACGAAVGMLPDQVPAAGEGEWADFFDRPAYTVKLALKLARRSGATCLLAWGERLPRGKGYVVHVRPMPPAEPGEREARHLNRAIESLVRERPGQYLWGYNRYKRPRRMVEHGPDLAAAPEQGLSPSKNLVSRKRGGQLRRIEPV